MGGLGRRHRFGAGRILSGPASDRARLVRPGRSGAARRPAGARSDCRRGMDPAPRDADRRHRPAQGAYPERAHRRRHGHRLCRRLCRVRGLRPDRSSRCLRAARRRGPLHACRGAAAWSGARRARRGRRVRHAADRLDRGAELLGALSLSCRGHRRRLCARPGQTVALACRHRGRRERTVGLAGDRRATGPHAACFPYRRRLHPGRTVDRVGFALRTRRHAGRDRPCVVRRACHLPVRVDGSGAGHWPRHARAHPVRDPGRRHDRHSLAERRGTCRGAGRRGAGGADLLALVDRFRCCRARPAERARCPTACGSRSTICSARR